MSNVPLLSAIIIDDEKRARDVLKRSLDLYCSQVSVKACCHDVPTAVKTIKTLRPDLVFLDIEMPNYSGFELLDFFYEIDFEIVFVTAYSQYAVQAFEVSAVDYLLKPLQIDRLESALKKVAAKRGGKSSADRMSNLQTNLSSLQVRKLALPKVGGYHFVDAQDILMLEAERAYCRFHLRNGEQLLVSKSLSHYEPLLKDTGLFFRAHRSYLLNLKAIKKYHRRKNLITLSNDIKVKVSRNKKDAFEDALGRVKLN